MRIFIVVLMGVQILFGKTEQWETFEKKQFEQKAKTPLPQLVIVRPSTVKGRAINVYIDGEYVTSLLPGAYTVELVCPGRHRIRLAYTNVQTRYKEKERGGQYFTFKPKKKYHFRIVKQEQGLMLEALSSQEIVSIKKHYHKRQHHTISRLSKRKCIKRAHTTHAGKGK